MAAKALIVLGLAACALGSHGYHGYGYSYAPQSYSYAPQNYGYGFTIGSHGYHKRDADASEPHYEPALAYHPAGGYGYTKYGPGYSYEYRSPQGLHKREAEPSKYTYSYGHGDHYGGKSYVTRYQDDGYGYGYHKREADASEPHYQPALAYHPAGGYGYNKYGPGYSYTVQEPPGSSQEGG